MKTANVTHYFIIGILIIITISFSLYTLAQNNESKYSQELEKSVQFTNLRVDFKDYIETCIKESVKIGLDDTGIRQDTINEYQKITSDNIKICSKSILDSLVDQEYKIKEGQISISVNINPETISIDLMYPLTIIKDSQKIEFNEFSYTFDRSNHYSIPDGITKNEIILTSPNGKTTLTFPEATEIKDKDGNPVELISIKVEDVHFDDLENKYVVGELAYDNGPEGAWFSKPVKMSIEFREEDIPEGYTKENIRIAYWNEGSVIWYASPTEIIGNRAVADIYHFSTRAIVVGKAHGSKATKESATKTNNMDNTADPELETVFFHRYYPTSITTAEDRKAWYSQGGPRNPIGIQILDTREYETLTDCKKIFEKKSNFIVTPKITYGYYKQSKNGDFIDYVGDKFEKSETSAFIECEPEEEVTVNGITFGTDINDNPSAPYIKTVECKISSCNDESVTGCQGDKYCKYDSNQYCVPVDANNIPIYIAKEQDENSKCVQIDEGEFLENTKAFGYHNFACVGGKARPELGNSNGPDGVSALIMFEGNGNSVIGILHDLKDFFTTNNEPPPEIINIHPLPAASQDDLKENANLRKTIEENSCDDNGNNCKFDKETYSYIFEGNENVDSNPCYNGNGECTKNDILGLVDEANTNKEFDYFCNIIPFPNNLGTGIKGNGKNTYIREVQLTEESKETATQKIKHHNVGPAYGIYGVDVIKFKKGINMEARCDVEFNYDYGSDHVRDHKFFNCKDETT
jgi:hypothetical protein